MTKVAADGKELYDKALTTIKEIGRMPVMMRV